MMTGDVTVSIIITTRNHAPYLTETLESMRGVRVPTGWDVELLIVDNGSTDDTGAVARNTHLDQIRIVVLEEPRTGQCWARNTGMANATGDIFLWTDDDTRLPADWIEGMAGPIARGETDAVAGGFRIAPHLQRPWMTSEHRQYLASSEGIDPQNPWSMIGGNMAFHRHVLEKVPCFDVELGPGTTNGFSDDTLFSLQIKEAGFRLITALEVSIEHHCEPSRLTRQSYLSTAQKRARGEAYVLYHWFHFPAMNFPVLRVALNAFRLSVWRFRNRALTLSAEGASEEELRLIQRHAFMDHLAHEQKAPRKYDLRGLIKKSGVIGSAAPVSKTMAMSAQR